MALHSVAWKCWCGIPQSDYIEHIAPANKPSFLAPACLCMCRNKAMQSKGHNTKDFHLRLTCATPLQYKQDTQQICSTKCFHRGISPNRADPGCSTRKMCPRAALSQHKSTTRTLITFPNFTQLTLSSPAGQNQ